MTKHAELVKYGLKSARRLRVVNGLSNTLTIVRADGPTFRRIAFTEDFVQAVGKKLPQGLHDSTPSGIGLIELAHGWMVVCYYLATPNRYQRLWTTETFPEWAGGGQAYHEINLTKNHPESGPGT